MTRHQRSHRCKSWQERFQRNARRESAPRYRLQLTGISPALATTIGRIAVGGSSLHNPWALRDALRARPDLRINLAVHRYTTEDISLAKAAHLAGISWPEMRDILRERGVPLRLGPESIEDARQEVQAIEGHLGRHE